VPFGDFVWKNTGLLPSPVAIKDRGSNRGADDGLTRMELS